MINCICLALRFRPVKRQLPSPILIRKLSGSIPLCLAGQSEAALQNQNITSVLSISQQDQKEFFKIFQKCSESNHVKLHVLDRKRILNAAVSALHADPDMLYVVALNDVTEAIALKRAERAAEKDALMAKAMKESMETLTHELRTPLQGIMGICSTLVSDTKLNLPENARDSLDIIMASSGLLLVLINNLLDIRKCDADMMKTFELTPIRAPDPLRDSANFCWPLAKISEVKIDIDMIGDAKSKVIMTNELRLLQVIINLVSNGIKHAPTGSAIQIQARCTTAKHAQDLAHASLASGFNDNRQIEGSKPVLLTSVKDSGPGVTPGQEKKMFQKFAQLNDKPNTVRKKVGQPAGTGLGLNLCQRFVQLMHGNIWVNNNVDGPGTTFSFFLPQAEEGLPLPRPKSSDRLSEMLVPTPTMATQVPSKSLPVEGKRNSGLRVLVVDDTLINRKVLDRMLGKVGVASVALSESGEDALLKIDSEEFGLVISDLQMPGGMSGLEFSQALSKKSLKSRRPAVVGLTADTSPDLYGRCIESGMVDLIHKPITLGDLHEALCRWRAS